MSKMNALVVLAAASMVSVSAVAPVYAQSIPAEETAQISNAASPDVDPGASKGFDKPIVVQEKAQVSDATGPSVAERSAAGGETIPQMEQDDLK